MKGILQGLPFAFLCIDDILIPSRTMEEHPEHLWTVLERVSRPMDSSSYLTSVSSDAIRSHSLGTWLAQMAFQLLLRR